MIGLLLPYPLKKRSQTRVNIGSSTGIEKRSMKPKNDGIRAPLCSAMDFTMKFGAFPMYVIAPKNTAPMLMALR
jgi:hypothetical protein